MSEVAEDVIFDRSTDKLVRPILIKGEGRRVTPEVVARFLDLKNTLSAKLMRHEALCFAVYGENMVIHPLLEVFGARGLLDLLEQGAIKFWLEADSILYFKSPQKGVMPLANGPFTTPVHSDPEASVAESLRRREKQPEAKAAKKLKRALADAYVAAPSSFTSAAVAFGHDGYRLGRFKFAGLDPAVPLDELDEPGRETLARLAGEMHDLSLIARLRMNTIDQFAIARVCHDSVDRLRRGRRVDTAYQQIFAIERMPDLAQLFRDGALDVTALPKLRQKSDAVKFRRWVRQVTTDPYSGDPGAEYLDALQGQGLLESKKGRLLKALSVSALSGAVGGALAGPIGVAAGVVAAPVALAGLDVGLDLFDEFVLGALLAGWNPRNYFENVLTPK